MKKKHKNNITQHPPSKAGSTHLSRKDLIIYEGTLVIYIFYLRSLNRIINYPSRIF
jgi:hypothetical protein